MRNEEESDEKPATKDEIARDLQMFRRFLLGVEIPKIAEQFGMSLSSCYRIAKRDKWKLHLAKLQGDDHQRIVDEVRKELTERRDFENSGIKKDDVGYFHLSTIVYPEGTDATKVGIWGFYNRKQSLTFEGNKIHIKHYLRPDEIPAHLRD